MVDCGFSETEEKELYESIIRKYSNFEDVVIKLHPRDLLDYKKYFPNVSVFDSKAPMQLVNVFDGGFERGKRPNFGQGLILCS